MTATQPWQDQGWMAWNDSGGWKNKQRSPSPRRIGKGKGKKGGKESAQPPAPPALATPSLTTATVDSSSAAQNRLEALTTALRASGGTLPPEVLALLGEQEQATTNEEARLMHKAVSEQHKARKEVNRVRAARRAFVDSWASYVSNLADTLDKQIAEQSKSLQQFDDLEQKWAQQLTEATESLAKFSGAPQKVDSDSDMEVNEKVATDPWALESAMAQQQQRQRSLVHALSSAKRAADTAADNMGQNKRDTSRTPSRTPRRKDNAADAAEAVNSDAASKVPQ